MRVLVKFDNGFSYWRNKNIFRRIEGIGGAEVQFLEEEDDALSDSEVDGSQNVHFDSVSEDPSKNGELAPTQVQQSSAGSLTAPRRDASAPRSEDFQSASGSEC